MYSTFIFFLLKIRLKFFNLIYLTIDDNDTSSVKCTTNEMYGFIMLDYYYYIMLKIWFFQDTITEDWEAKYHWMGRPSVII